MKHYFIPISFFLLSFCGKAQEAGAFKNSYNLKEDNRWEGTPEMPVGATIQLTGIHREVPTTFTAGDKLSIYFYQPSNTSTVIAARHKNPDLNNYRMEVKQRNWEIGWQTFTPWNVSEVLIPSHMTASDLGVLIKTTNGVYLPASVVKNSTIPGALNRYRFYIWPPGNIPVLTYKVLNSKGEVLIEKSRKENQAKIVISLLIDMQGFPTDNYKMELQNGAIIVASYTFYHVK